MTLTVDVDRIAEVAARLDLRLPNKEALETFVFEQSQWFDGDGRGAPFECVLDSATGVGSDGHVTESLDPRLCTVRVANDGPVAETVAAVLSAASGALLAAA